MLRLKKMLIIPFEEGGFLMIVSLIVLGIILLILGILTPIVSATSILISLILFIIAIVLSFKKRRALNN
jgi:predicted neutral ceramidase superfamily lipid hydrolase